MASVLAFDRRGSGQDVEFGKEISGNDSTKANKGGGGGRIRKDMQEKIDQYIAYHKQYREAENAMNKLRKEIEPYLAERSLREVNGTEGGRMLVELQPRAPISARYTSYDIEDLVQVVDDLDLLAECLVEVVDRDMLELMIKAGKLGDELLELKIYKMSDCLTVKHI